jgi:hypothetical protein
MRRDISQPLGVGHIGLTARHVLHMVRVAQPHLEPLLQREEHRLPIHPARFHRDQRHVRPPQPVTQPGQLRRRRPEPVLGRHRAPTRPRRTCARRYHISVHVQPRHPVMNPLHVNLPRKWDMTPTGEGLGNQTNLGFVLEATIPSPVAPTSDS